MTLRDVNEIKNEVASALRELAAVAGEAGAASLQERIQADRLPRLTEERAVLVVLGEFNHGKTTFVNALLGGPVLPTGITPTTSMIHEVRHGASPRAVLVRRPPEAPAGARPLDGPREEVAFSQLHDLVAGGRTKPEDVLRVEIEYPAELLRDRVTLVDTPGVNDLNHQRAEITYGYVPRADGVVFLLDAGQILKESERRFLRDRLLGAGRDRIVFAINKADLLSDAERAEVMEYATRQLSSLVPGAPVMFLSATRALAGDRAGSGLDALLGKLSSLLGNERLKMLVDYAADEGLRVGDLLGRGLAAKRRALSMTSEEFERRVGALEADVDGARALVEQRKAKIAEEIAAMQAVARRDLEQFTDEFAAAVRLEVEKSGADDIRKYLPGFIEDTWRTWLDAEAKSLGTQLEALAEQMVAIVNDDAHVAARAVEGFAAGTAAQFDVKVDTTKYDVGVFAVGALGVGVMVAVNLAVGAVVTAAAPALALLFKGWVDDETRQRALEAAPATVRASAAKIGPALDAAVAGFGEKLADFVASASEELRRAVLEVLASTRQALASAEAGEAPNTQPVDALIVRQRDLKARFERLRGQVWEQSVDGIAGIPMAIGNA